MERTPLIIGFVVGVLITLLGAWLGHGFAAPTRTVTVTTTVTRSSPLVCGVTSPVTTTVTVSSTRTLTIVKTVTSTTTRIEIVTRTLTPSAHTVRVTVTRTVTVTVFPKTLVATSRSGAKVLALLVESEYDSYVLNLVSHANRSVYVMMFVVKYYPHHPTSVVNRLLYALCQDRKRGIDVKVLLDYTSYEEYRQAIAFLKSCGVPVKVWHECGYLWRLHAKVVIVDGKIVVLGSHNWTYSALAHNIEVSVAIYSPKYASELTKLFNSLWSSSCSFSP